MPMWLHIFLPSLLGIAKVASDPVTLYCMEYQATINNNMSVSILRVVPMYPEYGEFCDLQIVYTSHNASCYPTNLYSPSQPIPMSANVWYFNIACHEYDFCNAILEDKLSYAMAKWNMSGQECLLQALKLLPHYWKTEAMKQAYIQWMEDKKSKDLKMRSEFVFHNNQTRFYVNMYVNSLCFNLYQYADDPFKASKVKKRSKELNICSIDVKFHRHFCTLIRVKLSRGRFRLAYRFHKDRDVDDAFTIGTWCEGDFCNRNLSYLADNLRLYYEQTNLTNCALKAVQEAIDLYSTSLENVYQAHMNLSEKEQKRIEYRDTKKKEKDMDRVKRKPKPLIERFQPVNQELLRESDYHIEMGKKSHMWIQYTILTYTTLALVISITCGIRKKRREQVFNIQRDDI